MALSEEKRVSPAATWSLILGVLGIGCIWIFGAIPAIILGFIALGKIVSEDSEWIGRDRAVAGIATGIVGLFVGLFSMGIWAAIFLPEPEPTAVSRADREAEEVEMAEIHSAIQRYSIIEGTYPMLLDALVPLYLMDYPQITTWDPGEYEEAKYRYRPDAYGERDPATAPVLLTPGPSQDEHSVLYVDGRIETTSDPEIITRFE